MKKIIEYNPSAIIKLQLKTSQRIAVQSAGNLAPILDLRFPVQESVARLMGRWIVECSSEFVLLRETDSEAREECLILSFQERYIDVELTCESPEGTYVEFLERVSRIEVWPRKTGLIKVDLQQELIRPEDTIFYLQKILETSFEGMVRAARENIEFLNDANRGTLEVLEDLLAQEEKMTLELAENRQKSEDLKEQLEIQQQEKEAMETEIRELYIQKEFLDLDCEAAEEELQELRTQVDLDSDTLALMDDGIVLKGGTVTATLTEVSKNMKDVEKRIASIIRFRTRFNDVVEEAIFSGDGTVLNSEEEMELEWEDIGEALMENLEPEQEEQAEVPDEQEAEPEKISETFTEAEPLMNCDENE